MHAAHLLLKLCELVQLAWEPVNKEVIAATLLHGID